ncbi:MAG: membrane dipeptidase [Anaerolineales bacterium]|nr:membrane dipeptidase [Anaerolineales bacterium]
MYLLVDAHEDLAWNILALGRDYTRPADETRQHEKDTPAIQHNGNTLLGWPDYQRARAAVVFGTLFATPIRRRLGEWDTQAYSDFEQAHRLYRTQLEAYLSLTDRHADKFRLIHTADDLEDVLTAWADETETHPVGLVILMEGAEGVRTPAELDEWWQLGVRIIGPAWAGTRFCGGTREPGALTEDGRALLKGMAEVGFTLDLSHMDELAARQSLDTYPGAIIASHANAAALIPEYSGNRQLPDAIIKGIVEREGVIGVVPYCKFLNYGWKKGDARDGLSLETLAAHIDHICQMAGDARHVGLGSDFDGGFGLEAAPADVDTIADLQKLDPILAARGYNKVDIAAILGGNWLHHLGENLPE